jgi:serine/threonine-protein kinase
MREARAAVKIHSEHIARVIDVNMMPNGSPYMVMEYLHGSDLSHVLQERGKLPLEEATLFVIEACDAIAEAHAYGIVHRDLKPANLFLAKLSDGSSRIKVLDFGISKSMLAPGSTPDVSLTRTSSMMGSPLYMSPEQIRSTRDVDSRTDIWALGVILYELLTGNLPFAGTSIPELAAKILLEPPTPLSHYRPDLPEALGAVLMRALQKDPNARYPTAGEFVLDLVPFAPRKARVNVERITKLLTQAGMSSSSLLPEAPAAREFASARTQTLQRGDSTVTEFGSTTKPKSAPAAAGKKVALGVAALALLGGVAFFAFGRGERAGVAGAEAQNPTPPVAAAPAAAPAEPHPAAPAPAAAPVRPVVPAVTPTPPTEPQAAASSSAPNSAVAPAKGVAHKASTVGAQPKSTAQKTVPAAPTAAPVATTPAGGFKSKYGGRK